MSRSHRIRRALVATVGALAASWVLVPSTSATVDTTNYYTVSDDGGIDDEVGQKDLTQQGWTYEDADTRQILVAFFNFDEVVTKGGNTLDGCLLFDANDNDLVDFAQCGTTGKSDVSGGAPKASTLYTCKDTRADRCAQATVKLGASADTTCYEVDRNAPKGFAGDPDPDTRIYCRVRLTDVGVDSGKGELLNTCSYPSAEPNSDPSDCVVNPGKAEPTAAGTTSVYPNASITLTDWREGGNASTVDFYLYGLGDTGCTSAEIYHVSVTPIAVPMTLTAVAATANTSFALTTNGMYYWKVVYSGNDQNYGVTLDCGTLSTYVEL